MALASSEQTVFEVNVYVELVGGAQMTNTDEKKGGLWVCSFSETTALQEPE